MAAHGVLLKSRVAAKNIDSLNRTAVCSGSDLDNGNVFNLFGIAAVATNDEVWNATVPSLAAGTGSGLWMAATPEVVVVLSGTYAYKGLNDDPRNFYNISGSMIDAFQPQKNDMIKISSAAITGSPSTGVYVVPAEGTFKLAWSATAPTSGSNLCFKEVEESYFSIGSGSIDNQRVLAYRLQCVSN